MSMAHTADQTTARRAPARQRRADRSEAIANYLTPERLQRWSHAASVLIAGLLISLAVVEPASAQAASGGGDVGTFIANILAFFNSTVIRGLAVLSIIILGLLCMFGIMDFRRAALVVVGIILVFGASTLVGMITGTGSSGA